MYEKILANDFIFETSTVEISDNGVSITSQTFEIDRSNWELTYNTEGAEGVVADYAIMNEIAFTIHANVTK